MVWRCGFKLNYIPTKDPKQQGFGGNIRGATSSGGYKIRGATSSGGYKIASHRFWVWRRTNHFGWLQDSGGYKPEPRILGPPDHQPVLENL